MTSLILKTEELRLLVGPRSCLESFIVKKKKKFFFGEVSWFLVPFYSFP